MELQASKKVVQLVRKYQKFPSFLADTTTLLEEILVLLLLLVNFVERKIISHKLIERMLKYRGNKHYDIDSYIRIFEQSNFSNSIKELICQEKVKIGKNIKLKNIDEKNESQEIELENLSLSENKNKNKEKSELDPNRISVEQLIDEVKGNPPKKGKIEVSENPEEEEEIEEDIEKEEEEYEEENEEYEEEKEEEKVEATSNNQTEKNLASESHQEPQKSIKEENLVQRTPSREQTAKISLPKEQKVEPDEIPSSNRNVNKKESKSKIVKFNVEPKKRNANKKEPKSKVITSGAESMKNSTFKNKTNAIGTVFTVNGNLKINYSRLSICNIITTYLCFWTGKKMRKKYNVLVAAEKKINYYMDIYTYIQKIQEIDLMKYCLFDDDQNSVISFLSKPPVKMGLGEEGFYKEFAANQKNIFHIQEEEIKKLYASFSNIKNKKELSFEDLKLIRLVLGEISFLKN